MLISNLYLIFRKITSFFVKFRAWLNSFKVYFAVFFNGNVCLGSNCFFSRNVSLSATDGGSISIGNNVSLSHDVTIVARGGRIIISDDVFIGPGSMIVAISEIFIGHDSLVAEHVTIRDQSHRTSSIPYRLSGFDTSPVTIGKNVWIGAKVSILKGVSIGDSAVIGAHALVLSSISANKLAVGIPAKEIRSLEGFYQKDI
jgi:acetyltransferase-like isoleucine patch superfamily enzyme